MVSKDNDSRASGEIGLFDVADWLWPFRWLGLAFLTIAVIWTGVVFWTGRQAPAAVPGYTVTTSIYPSGTPVRQSSDIAGILRSRLASVGLTVRSELGANPVVVNVPTNDATKIVIAAVQEVEGELIADVKAQVTILAPLMRSENVPDSVAAQYIKNVSFLDGQANLIHLLDPVVTRRAAAETGTGRTQIMMPWLVCGAAFFAIAGGISFTRAWKAHRARGLAGKDLEA